MRRLPPNSAPHLPGLRLSHYVIAHDLRSEFQGLGETIRVYGVAALLVMVDGKESDLSSREYVLLETILRHPGHVLTREQLLSRVWGYDFDPGSTVVDVYVRYLRRKIVAATIETMRGMGYRLRV